MLLLFFHDLIFLFFSSQPVVVFGDMFCRQGSLSSRLMAFLCSVMRDLIVFDVSPMYTFSQSWHGIWYNAFCLSLLFGWFLCVLKRDLNLFAGL